MDFHHFATDRVDGVTTAPVSVSPNPTYTVADWVEENISVSSARRSGTSPITGIPLRQLLSAVGEAADSGWLAAIPFDTLAPTGDRRVLQKSVLLGSNGA